ncbi:MAG: hypothetical protein H0U03_11145 [Actinobacteria bacterium]|nr:hypothetical protein [Actinomycetota bacterium]
MIVPELIGEDEALVGVRALIAVMSAPAVLRRRIHAIMTLRIPPALRPTVMTSMMMVFALVQPLGVFGVGPVLDAFGARPVLFAFAAVQTVTMAAIVLISLRERDRLSAQPALAR